MKVFICVNNYTQIQGINSVVDQFFFNRELFKQKGIDIAGVYDCKRVYYDRPLRTLSNNKGINSIFHTLKGTFLYKTYIGQIIAVIIRMILPAFNCYKNSKTSNADVFLTQDVFVSYFLLKKSKKVKLIFMTHMYERQNANLLMNYPKLKGTFFERYLEKINQYVFLNSDAIVTICKNANNKLVQDFGLKKVYTVYNTIKNTVSEQALPGTHDKVRFVSASHLTFVKGIDMLCTVLKEICKTTESKDCEFHLYGDGEYYKELVKLKRDEGLENLFLYGNVQTPYKNYTDKDVYISTSRMETLPMGILEAMSVGLPILSTSVGAIPELICDENGLLVKPEVEDIKCGILKMIGLKKHLQVMGVNSKFFFETNCSRAVWVDKFTLIFNEVINKV